MEERGELCLQEEVARLWDRGLSGEEIADEMGLDRTWVEATVSTFAPRECEEG